MTLVLLYWRQALLAILLGGLGLLGYQHVYHKGYEAASVKYERQIKEYNDKIDNRISTLESSSTVLIEQTLLGNQATKVDLAKVLKTLSNKPLYTIDSKGACKLSDDFVKAYNDGIARVNK